MHYHIRFKQGLGVFLGMALLAGIPSALTAAEESRKAKSGGKDNPAPQNFVIEMEVAGNTPLLAVLRSYDGHLQADIGDPKVTLQLNFREVSEGGAVADYTFGIRNKIENTQNGKVISYSFEEQMIRGSIYLARGEKTEVFRTVPLSLSFTLKEIGKTAAEVKVTSVKVENRQHTAEHRKVVIPTAKPSGGNPKAPSPPTGLRLVPTSPPVKKSGESR